MTNNEFERRMYLLMEKMGGKKYNAPSWNIPETLEGMTMDDSFTAEQVHGTLVSRNCPQERAMRCANDIWKKVKK